MDALGINLGYLLMQIFAFLILILLLRGWLYEPILKVLDDRKARIAKGLEDARQAAIARDNADTEAKKIMDEARAEAARIRADAAVQAEETAAGILAKANDDARALVSAAQTDAEEERNRILSELRNQVASISIAAANKLLGEALDDKRQRRLISDFFSKVPASVAQLEGASAVVTSALPLSDQEKDTVRKSLKAADVDFRVDPGILGGVIVRVGDQVVDDSVAGQMNGLRESMLR